MLVVAVCCVIFCKIYNQVSHYYAQILMTLLFESFHILHNKYKYRILLWSLWLSYILFAEKFKPKINIFSCFETFVVFMAYLS